jgi:hypothetical protein
MQATHNTSLVTQDTLRFTLRDLATPLLRRKRIMSLTFLFVVPATLVLDHAPFHQYPLPSFFPLLPAHGSAVTLLIAILLGLLAALFLTYLVDSRDPCFHSPAQVIRTLRIPLVVAIPKRTP